MYLSRGVVFRILEEALNKLVLISVISLNNSWIWDICCVFIVPYEGSLILASLDGCSDESTSSNS